MKPTPGAEDPIVHLNGEYLPLSQARISVEDRGFLFADGVYESFRYYPPRNGRPGGVFALQRHLSRLRQSLEGIRLGGVDVDRLADLVRAIVPRNRLDSRDATIYLQVTRGVAPRAHGFPVDTSPTVYAIARPFTPPESEWARGVEVALVEDMRWGRCDLKSIALLPNVLASQIGRERGAYEAVLVRGEVVTEGSHTAVAFVREGVVWTHPEGPEILPSVTRQIVLELCASEGVETVLRPMPVRELARVDEMMILGTSNEVMPVVRVDGHLVGNGEVGPVTRRLQRAFASLHS